MNIVHAIIEFSNYFFLFYLIIYATYTLICSVFGSAQMYKYRKMDDLHNVLDHEFYYPVSIIVPAFNENYTLVQTVENLLLQDYKLFEIVVVDDGSTDDTKQIMIDTFDLKREISRPIHYSVPCRPIKEVYIGEKNGIRILLVSKVNGGRKADAANAGINMAEYPYVVNMDADEILQRDALKLACRAILEDDNVVCVGGNIKMSNSVTFENAMPVETRMGENLVVDMQVIEYGRSFVGTRIFQNNLNMNLIVSGGFGLFKKSVLIEIGGYDVKSMGEDMEVTVRIHEHFRRNKKPYSMRYVPNSVCWTQAPATMKDLKKQRERWYCGLVQTMTKYKYMFLNFKYGLIGTFMMPYMLFYELLNPFFMVLGWFVIGWTIFDRSINFPYVWYVYLLYFVFGVFQSMISFWDKIYMNENSVNTYNVVCAFFTAFMDCVFFRLYLSFISFIAIFKVNKTARKWVSPTRVVVKSK